jgi:hypothetical protein
MQPFEYLVKSALTYIPDCTFFFVPSLRVRKDDMEGPYCIRVPRGSGIRCLPEVDLEGAHEEGGDEKW